MNFIVKAKVTDNDPDEDYSADDFKYDLSQFLADQNLEVVELEVISED